MAKVRLDSIGYWVNYNGKVTRPLYKTSYEIETELLFISYVDKNGMNINPWIYVTKYQNTYSEVWLISEFPVTSYTSLNKYLYSDVFFNLLKINKHLESNKVHKYQTQLFSKIIELGNVLNSLDSKQTKKTLAQEDQIFNIVDSINVYIDILLETFEFVIEEKLAEVKQVEYSIIKQETSTVISNIIDTKIFTLDVTGLTARDSILKLIEYFNTEIKPISIYLNNILDNKSALSNKKQTLTSLKKKLLKDENLNLIF